jgi:hypothetical protein
MNWRSSVKQRDGSSDSEKRSSDLRYISEAQVLNHFGLDQEQLAAWVEAGELRRQLARGRWRYAVADLVRLRGWPGAEPAKEQEDAPRALRDDLVVLRRERDMWHRSYGRAAQQLRQRAYELQVAGQREGALQQEVAQLRARVGELERQLAYGNRMLAEWKSGDAQAKRELAQLKQELQQARQSVRAWQEEAKAQERYTAAALAGEQERWSARQALLWRVVVWVALLCLLVGLIAGYVVWR